MKGKLKITLRFDPIEWRVQLDDRELEDLEAPGGVLRYLARRFPWVKTSRWPSPMEVKHVEID